LRQWPLCSRTQGPCYLRVSAFICGFDLPSFGGSRTSPGRSCRRRTQARTVSRAESHPCARTRAGGVAATRGLARRIRSENAQESFCALEKRTGLVSNQERGGDNDNPLRMRRLRNPIDQKTTWHAGCFTANGRMQGPVNRPFSTRTRP
jgi:hypothetical protein